MELVKHKQCKLMFCGVNQAEAELANYIADLIKTQRNLDIEHLEFIKHRAYRTCGVNQIQSIWTLIKNRACRVDQNVDHLELTKHWAWTVTKHRASGGNVLRTSI